MGSSTLCIYSDQRKWINYPKEFKPYIDEANRFPLTNTKVTGGLLREQLWNKEVILAEYSIEEIKYGVFEFFSQSKINSTVEIDQLITDLP
jgi:hypothetical protein